MRRAWNSFMMEKRTTRYENLIMQRFPIVSVWILAAAAIAGETAAQPAEKPAAAVDVVIRNGLVIDGAGGPAVRADVAIDAGRITAVGQLPDVIGKQTIDARDRVVCPGFIDLHSHADSGITEFRAAENYIRQGVTTLVCGN